MKRCKHYTIDCEQEKMGCEGCAYNNKSADEMFEELGYVKYFENSDVINYGNNDCITISFYNGMKTVEKSAYPVNIQELKAINKKVEELGWK